MSNQPFQGVFLDSEENVAIHVPTLAALAASLGSQTLTISVAEEDGVRSILATAYEGPDSVPAADPALSGFQTPPAAGTAPAGAPLTGSLGFNAERRGLEITFSGKPESEHREMLKANGFRWHRQARIWYARDTEARRKFVTAFFEHEIGSLLPAFPPIPDPKAA